MNHEGDEGRRMERGRKERERPETEIKKYGEKELARIFNS